MVDINPITGDITVRFAISEAKWIACEKRRMKAKAARARKAKENRKRRKRKK